MKDFVTKNEGNMNVEETKEFIQNTLKGTNLQEEQINEFAWKNACGIELTQDVVNELRIKHKTLPELKSESKDAKISWLIRYLDSVPKEALIGLKISNIGKIEYAENNIIKKEEITLAIGDTDTNNNVKNDTNQGLYHMKYGKNNHWNESKDALHIIPKDFINGELIKAEESSKYLYYYRYKRKNYLYVIGIPSDKGDATVLITCLKLG